MKAIHNSPREIVAGCALWTIHKDTKNESNSQHQLKHLNYDRSCELYTKIQKMKAIHNEDNWIDYLKKAVNYTQRYKKWKQFTTAEWAHITAK